MDGAKGTFPDYTRRNGSLIYTMGVSERGFAFPVLERRRDRHALRRLYAETARLTAPTFYRRVKQYEAR